MIKIRAFIEDDRPVLRRIYLSSRKQTFYWLDTAAYRPEDFDEATVEEEIIVAEDEREVIGLIAFLRQDIICSRTDHNIPVRSFHQGII